MQARRQGKHGSQVGIHDKIVVLGRIVDGFFANIGAHIVDENIQAGTVVVDGVVIVVVIIIPQPFPNFLDQGLPTFFGRYIRDNSVNIQSLPIRGKTLLEIVRIPTTRQDANAQGTRQFFDNGLANSFGATRDDGRGGGR